MFKIIAAILFCLYFFYEVFQNILALKSRERGIPEELGDVYDQPTYERWKAYHLEKTRLALIGDVILFAVDMVLLFSGVYPFLVKDIASPYLAAFLVFGINIAADTLLSIPTDYVDTFVIEQKYGFNRTKAGTFIADQIKSLVLVAIIGFGLLSLYILMYEAIGDFILLLFAAVLLAITFFLMFLAPLFMRIFNKFTPLEEGELREKLIALLEKHDFKVRDIKVMDASRRTTKANAYFTGFGKTKTIVLFDTILSTMENDEIVAVFAHELGHGLHRDTMKNSLFAVFEIAVIVTLAWLLSRFPAIYADFGFSSVNYGFAALLLMFVAAPFTLGFFEPLLAYRSRRAEFRADAHAVEEGYGDALVSGLKKLYRVDLGDLNPHPWLVALTFSHPTLLQRVRHIEECKKKTRAQRISP